MHIFQLWSMTWIKTPFSWKLSIPRIVTSKLYCSHTWLQPANSNAMQVTTSWLLVPHSIQHSKKQKKVKTNPTKHTTPNTRTIGNVWSISWSANRHLSCPRSDEGLSLCSLLDKWLTGKVINFLDGYIIMSLEKNFCLIDGLRKTLETIKKQ